MSDEERAAEFIAAQERLDVLPGGAYTPALRHYLTALLAEVRTEERERCAKVCDEHADRHRVGSARASAVICAALIREGKP